MTDAFAAIERAFSQLPQRPAVFDCAVREQANCWWLQTPVPVEEVVEAFAAYDSFARNGRIRVPIHEADSAELTGEYLYYDGENVVFYDFSADGFRRMSLEQFRYSYPAWRVRYWVAGTNPDAVPSYLAETGATLSGDSTASIFSTNSSNDNDAVTDAIEAAGAVATEGGTGDGDSTSGSAFFEELRSFVEREREAERNQKRNAYESMKQRAFFEEYGGVQSVSPMGREVNDYGEQIINLRVHDGEDLVDSLDAGDAADVESLADTAVVDDDKRTEDGTDGSDSEGRMDIPDEYGLYPGMEVFIDRIDDPTGFPVEAELFDVSGSTLQIGVYWDSSDEKGAAESAFGEESGAEFVVGELLNPVTFDRKVDAISTIENDDRKRGFVTGDRTLDVTETSYSHVGADDLNPSQQTAARAALRANDVYCIHGPPGTGKTRTLTAIMRAAVDENLRVLACAHSNQAVDNLLVGSSSPSRADPRSIHADAVEGEVKLARAGNNSGNDVVADRYVGADTWQADVVGATTSAASTLADDMFDIVLVDEATQATIPSTLIAMTKADRTILAGDHKQLPPYHAGERDDAEGTEFSLFEHLLEQYGEETVATTLSTQYRMHEAIAAFPNAAFYEDRLVHGQRNRTWTIGSLDPLVALDVDGEEGRTSMGSYYNRPEATRVVEEVERLLEHGVVADDIGVITPYTGQVAIVRADLFDAVGESTAERVKIDTVDSFQGGEREAVVVSFVRSNEEGNIGFLDFPLEGPRRLNVALTRAQKRLVLIGDWDTLAAGKDEAESASRYYGALKEHLTSTGVLRSD